MHFTWEYTDKAKQVQFHFFTFPRIFPEYFPKYVQNIRQNISRTFAFNILQVQTVGPISPLDFYNQWVKPVWNIEDKICLVNSSFQPYNTFIHFNFTLVQYSNTSTKPTFKVSSWFYLQWIGQWPQTDKPLQQDVQRWLSGKYGRLPWLANALQCLVKL